MNNQISIKYFKTLCASLLVLLSFNSNAQLNNSWINYNQTYYKFRIANDILCRIPQSALSSAGLGSVNASHFQLWRNGKEVRMYTSVSSGPLGANGYIEFLGQMNDGETDLQLYRKPDFQLADRYSLETDTVAYFLTVNTAGGNLRYNQSLNAAPVNTTPDAYFMRSIDFYYNDQLNRGEARPIGEYVYSSSYDPGEGWSSNDIYPCCDLMKEFKGLNVYNAGSQNSLSIRINAVGCAPNSRNIRVKLFQTEITSAPYGTQTAMSNFDYKRLKIDNLPLSLIQNNNLPVYVNGTSSVEFDRMVVSNIGITFPSTFNFSGSDFFEFELDASPLGNYLVIDDFNYGATAPVLYDKTSGDRYLGEIISTPGKVKFVLPPSTNSREFVLMNQEKINSIVTLETRNFQNYSLATNQGNYIIISHPALFNDGNGNNYVDDYKKYRSSADGGAFKTIVCDINELTDQFGFGIKHHPGAIRDFIRYASTNFSSVPENVFIIGRGVSYSDQRPNESNPLSDKLNFVTTFGWPASDILLAALPGQTLPIVPIGRLAAISGSEVHYYLEKIKQYETAQRIPKSSVSDQAWMKNFLHVAGGKDDSENASFKSYMNSYKNIVADTSFGAYVETFTKTSTGAVQQLSSSRIEELFEEGLGFVGYFGHSSANTFEFNLSNPELYNNVGKYPFFNVSGCSAGNFYIFDPLRLGGNLTLSEKYVLANQSGSIGFLADSHFGIPPFLNFYNTSLYNSFTKTMYGSTVGQQIKKVIQDIGGTNPNLDFFRRIHAEEINLHGDPALKINYFSKPDFVIEDAMVKISPNIITVAENNFKVDIAMKNIGKAVGDSIWVSVKRKLPNDEIKVLFDKLIPSIRNTDSIKLTVPITPNTDKGLNKLIVELDYTNRFDEAFETNNAVTKDFYIFEDELRPVYPYNFSIVNKQNIKYVASTANPISGVRQYVMEVDTTELFNSVFKKTYNKSGIGGIVEFDPTDISFKDSTVYYWRVAMVPNNNQPYIWNSHSFVYLSQSSSGFNQSHYFQFLKSDFNNINLNQDRKFVFNKRPRSLIIRTGLFPYFNYDKINVNLDFDQLELYGCIEYYNPIGYNNLQVYVFDTTTLIPWRNSNVSASNGKYGSKYVCQNSATPNDPSRAFFEFNYADPVQRKAAMDFIDFIPDGMYIALTNLGRKTDMKFFIDQWKDDTLALGSGKSLYHKLKSIGFTKIDSLYKNLPFLYFYKKGSTDFSSTQIIGPYDSSYIDQTFSLNSTESEGSMTSPVYGPVKSWTSLHWNATTKDPTIEDTVKVQICGVKKDGTSSLLSTVAPSKDTSLAFVDATIYPFMKLVVSNKDMKYITPGQLKYLTINASLVPEGAVAPSVLFKSKDTLDQGEPLDFKIAFKNISETSFEQLIKVKFVLTDQDNVQHLIDIPKRKTLITGDTLTLSSLIDTKNYPGKNSLFVEFNPDEDQPEQFHFNNILFKDFYVKPDKYNPLLDVTFDGVHILNKDIVASKPQILIKLKDESRFLELKDQSLLTLQLRYPDQSIRTFEYGDTMRFIPANISQGENTASIDFKPYLPEDGEYELIVTGKDVMGNKAGNLEYRVVFNVINKAMISNLLNYPNPFTTSTAFVFTVTGATVPQNIRIQILTVTGKVVKEITKEELGPVHIGRNITDYKWDGTDMYGQKLANGVYLYRVITNNNGKSLEKYTADGDNTDKYFNKGYGKMYLMR